MAELTADPQEDGWTAPAGSLVLFRLSFPAGDYEKRRHNAVRWPVVRLIDFAGPQIMGAWTGSAFASPPAPAEERHTFRISPRPLTPAVRSAAQFRQHRVRPGREPAINDDNEAKMPPRLRQTLPRGCVRTHCRP